jgi:hypothetical protein
MAYLRPYRVAETTTSTGTGNVTIAGAVAGYGAFSDELAGADTATIVIEAIDANGAPTGQWEICDTVFTSPSTLSRGTLRDSSTNSRIDFAAGTKRVFAISPRDAVDLASADVMGKPAGDLVGSTDTQTLTNKRINPRVVAASGTSGNLTINGDTTDVYKAEGLTGAITFLQPSGTPVDGQKLMIRLEDDGTARGITWTTSAGAFREVGVTLPTTTVATKITYVGCVYNGTDSFWDAIATVTQA